jgi:hypothetical protein
VVVGCYGLEDGVEVVDRECVQSVWSLKWCLGGEESRLTEAVDRKLFG